MSNHVALLWIFFFGGSSIVKAYPEFQGSQTLTGGQYEGETIEPLYKWPITIARETADEVIFHGFYHLNTWHTARLRIADLKAVRLSFVSQHTCLQFDLRQGIELTDAEGQTQTIKSFVHTVNGVGPQGVMWEPEAGLRQSFAAAQRVISEQQFLFEEKLLGQKPRYIMLNLTRQQRERLLRNALRASHETGFSRLYSFTWDSCVAITRELIDEAIGFRTLLPAPLITFDPETFVRRRGIIMHESPLAAATKAYDLDDISLAADPYRGMKRDFLRQFNQFKKATPPEVNPNYRMDFCRTAASRTLGLWRKVSPSAGGIIAGGKNMISGSSATSAR